MVRREEKGSKAKSQPAAQPVSPGQPEPFGTPAPLHREPPLILGEAVHVPDETDDKTGEEKPPADPLTAAAAPEPLETTPASESEEIKAAAEGAAPEIIDEEPGKSEDGLKSQEAFKEEAFKEEPLKEEPFKNEEPPGGPPQGATPPPPLTAPPPPARGGISPVALLLAAVIGAVAGLGGAYGAHVFLDDSQERQSALNTRFAGLDNKLAADEKKIDAAANGNRDALSALDKRLAGVETAVRNALGVANTAQTQAQAALAQAQKGSTAASADASGAPAAEPPDLAPLQARIDNSDQKITDLGQRLDGLDQRLAKLETTLNAPKTAVRAPEEREVKQDPLEANAPAIAIIAETLVQKVAGGAPFGSELSALENLGFDKTKLASLKPAAAKGIITERALSDQFNALVPALLEQDKPAAQGNFFDRLAEHAAALVRVRKIGDLSGQDLRGQVARVQDALAHDDIARALKEQAAFPAAAKSATADWAAAAKNRMDAIAAAKAISAETMANLTKVKS